MRHAQNMCLVWGQWHYSSKVRWWRFAHWFCNSLFSGILEKKNTKKTGYLWKCSITYEHKICRVKAAKYGLFPKTNKNLPKSALPVSDMFNIVRYGFSSSLLHLDKLSCFWCYYENRAIRTFIYWTDAKRVPEYMDAGGQHTCILCAVFSKLINK